MNNSSQSFFRSRFPWANQSGLLLFIASFIALFLELLLIRWVPSLIRVVAYYGNLMLVSSFLGLGCGVLLARRRLNLYKWFPPALFLLVCFVVVMKGIRFQQGPHELRFLFQTTATPTLLPILIVFVLNTLVFVPLGGLIGSFFQQLAPLRAYAWDIGGAIAGTTVFGLFSYFWFSPIVGCLGVMVIYFVYCRDVRHAIVSGAFFATSVWLMTERIHGPCGHHTIILR